MTCPVRLWRPVRPITRQGPAEAKRPPKTCGKRPARFGFFDCKMTETAKSASTSMCVSIAQSPWTVRPAGLSPAWPRGSIGRPMRRRASFG